jgi:hypothetical protein
MCRVRQSYLHRQLRQQGQSSTTLGEETSKEFATGVTTVLTLPSLDPAILARHATRVLANTTRLEAKILNLEAQQTAIIAALAAAPHSSR